MNLVVASLMAGGLLMGCTKTTGPTPGTGYTLMTPKRSTAIYITRHDRRFAETVALNNRTCRKHKGCIK